MQRTGVFSALAVVCGVASILLAGAESVRAHDDDNIRVRWDIPSLVPPNVFPGGVASARAADGSRITLTGSGTFEIEEAEGHHHRGQRGEEVTGGGAWETRNATGTVISTGTYEVTGFVSFVQTPPGTVGFVDQIGNPAEASGGLIFLHIAYSDGETGVLAVSCAFGATDKVAEGVSASKGFVDYFNIQPPVAGVNANRTLFHVSREHEN